MMRILVTGSNGFIGSNVCRYLKKEGNYVIGLGRRTDSAIEDVDEYVSCDLSTDDTMHVFKNRKIDAVVHLAADMRQRPYETDVVYHNCVGTQRLLEACEKNCISVFVQLSSLPVIGQPKEHPITENHSLRPPTVYHVTKHTQEMLANFADYKYGLRTVSFRISAPGGIGMKQSTIFPTFVRNAVAGNDIVLHGRGTRKQTYVHVDDIAQAIYKAIQCKNARGVYNLASYHCLSNEALAQMCISVLQSSSKIVFNGEEDPMDGDVWDVSLEHIKEIGYEPIVTMEYAILEQAKTIKDQN